MHQGADQIPTVTSVLRLEFSPRSKKAASMRPSATLLKGGHPRVQTETQSYQRAAHSIGHRVIRDAKPWNLITRDVDSHLVDVAFLIRDVNPRWNRLWVQFKELLPLGAIDTGLPRLRLLPGVLVYLLKMHFVVAFAYGGDGVQRVSECKCRLTALALHQSTLSSSKRSID